MLRTPLSRVAAVVSIGTLYCVARFFVYRSIPVTSWTDWFYRDAVMNGPRLAGFLICCFIGLRYYGWKLRLPATPSVALVISALFAFTVEAITRLLRSQPISIPYSTAIMFYLSSFMVALFEETLFRGVAVEALREWKGTRVAVWISSLAFTLFHVQAQPLKSWPFIFCYGLMFALLRVYGRVPLIWLILIHGIHDCIFGFVAKAGPSLFPEWHSIRTALWITAVLALWLFSLKEKTVN